jgi:hypothetical protein
MRQDNLRILQGEAPSSGSVNEVRDVPAGFKKWVADNEARIAKANNRGTLPYFLKDNANFAGISVNKINMVNRSEFLKASKSKYDSYNQPDWERAYFDERSGGFNVYHKDHQFTPTGGGGDAEIAVGKMLARYNGKQVEFLPENSYKRGNPDLSFDDSKWDVKYINEANIESIRSAIKDARKAKNAIFYWDKNDRLEDLKSAVGRSIGHFKKHNILDTMPNIYYMNNDGILKPLFIK